MIEQDLNRLATAMERIASAMEKMARMEVIGVPTTPLVKPTVTPTPVSTEPPMMGGSSASSAAPSDASPSVEAEAVATTSDQVLDLAQKVAAQLGEKVPAFTEWVRKTLAEKYNIASQKIKHLSAEQIPNFARDVMAYANKAGVKI